MNFIITRFLRMIDRDYGFNYTLTRNSNGSYVCVITGIPKELRNKLITVKYSFSIGTRIVKNIYNKITGTEDIMSHNPVCEGIYNPLTGVYGICVTFTEKDYANKVNKLDYEIRRYYENHSRIDEINHKAN